LISILFWDILEAKSIVMRPFEKGGVMRGSYLLRSRLLIGFLLFVFTGCEYFQTDKRELVYVTATVLNLRDHPTTKSNVVGRLKRGQELAVIEKGDGWLHVQLEDETTGWVHGDYVGDAVSVREALQKDLAHRSTTSKPRVRQQPVPTPEKTTLSTPKSSDEMVIDDMMEGLPDDLPLEEMDPLEGQPRFMGAAVAGQVVVEFWGPETDLQRAEIMVSTVDVSDADLHRNADFVRTFVQNAIPQWKRDTDWVVDFLKGLSSKDKGQGGFDTKGKTVRFLFIKPLGAIRVTIEKT
jgi:uncharacterized protein YraI